MKEREAVLPRILLVLSLFLLLHPVRAQQDELDIPRSDTLRKGSALHEVMRNGTLQGRFRMRISRCHMRNNGGLSVHPFAPGDPHLHTHQ